MVTLVTNNIKNKGITVNAYSLVVKSVFWNLFSWIMIIIALGITLFGLGFGKFKIGKAEEEKEKFTKGHIEKEELIGKFVEEYPKNSSRISWSIKFSPVQRLNIFWSNIYSICNRDIFYTTKDKHGRNRSTYSKWWGKSSHN